MSTVSSGNRSSASSQCQVLEADGLDLRARELGAGRIRDREASLGRAVDQMRDRCEVRLQLGIGRHRAERRVASVVAVPLDQRVDDRILAETRRRPER